MKSKKLLAGLLSLSILFASACSNDVESPKEETKTEEKVDEKDSSNSGKFEGVGKGLNGDVKIELTYEDGEIKDVKVVEHKESEGIADPALEQIPAKIVEEQNINVDTVSGATVTSTAIIDAVKQALEAAGANADDFMKEAEETSKEGQTIEKEYDVVVVGGGGSGLAAAVAALEEDASVLVLEKMPAVGGSTIIAGGQYNAVDKPRQEKMPMRKDTFESVKSYYEEEAKNDLHQELMDKLKDQVAEYEKGDMETTFDSVELHALQTYRGGDYVGNLELIYQFTKGAEESVGVLEGLGVDFVDEVFTVTGALWPRTHQFVKPLTTGPIEAYMEHIEKAGDKAEIMYEAAAEKLIVEDGKVVGVEAKQGNDKIIARAKNGVVMATGGFARNSELVKKYGIHWEGLEELGSTNAVSATGDGIIMGEEVGAKLVGMEWIQLLPVGDPETGGMQGNISINAANQLFVNNQGKRFVAEDERRDVLTQGLMEQDGKEMWILHDAHEYTDETVKNDFNEEIGDLVEKGVAVKGDTIEELAEAMGVSPENLRATVDDYNKVVAGEKEDDFGKKLLQDPFDKAPFYASRRVPTIHHTMGGLEINEFCQVVDKDGNVIPGLYAAGEVTGGIHGSNRLGGNAIPDTVVNGRIAGKSAAQKK